MSESEEGCSNPKKCFQAVVAKTTDASGVTNQATGPKIAKPCRQLAPNIPGTIASQATHTVRQDIKEASTASNEELLQVDDNYI